MLYETLIDIVDSGLPLQDEIIYDRLNQTKIFDQIGGSARVTMLRRLDTEPEEATTHARIIADRALQREIMVVGNKLNREGATADPHELIHETLETMARMNGKIGNVGDLRILQSSVTGEQLVATDIRRPESIVGDGVVTENSFFLLYGRPGLGKTWLMLQLAISVALGKDWLGLPTRKSRVGIIEMEMHTYYLKERLEALLLHFPNEDDRREALKNIDIICRPNYSGIIDLSQDSTRNGITSWIRDRGIELALMDALSRLHYARETDAQEMGKVLGNIEQIRDETRVGIGSLHHEPKGPSEGKKELSDIDAARGSSRLQSDPHTMMRLKVVRQRLCLVFPKMNLGPEVEPIWLEKMDTGGVKLCEAPADMVAVAEQNRERIRFHLEKCDYNTTIDALAEAVSMSTRTVRRHLKAMGLSVTRDGLVQSLFPPGDSSPIPKQERAPRSEEGAPEGGTVQAEEDEAEDPGAEDLYHLFGSDPPS